MYFLLLIVAAMTGEGSKDGERTRASTWGKKDVDFADYLSDSVDCAIKGYYKDTSNTAPARKFMEGWRIQEQALNGPAPVNVMDNANSILRTRPKAQMQAIQEIHQEEVARCLRARGYKEVRLSAEEEEHLRALPRGSIERKHYLYTIGEMLEDRTP